MRDESSPIVRLSTRDVAPADRLSYASLILGSALAPAAVSTGTPLQYELDVTALELPSIVIVAQSGSPQRSIRARSEIRRTSQRYFFLVLVLSGSWQVAHVMRTRLGPGDITFYDSRDPLDCDLLLTPVTPIPVGTDPRQPSISSEELCWSLASLLRTRYALGNLAARGGSAPVCPNLPPQLATRRDEPVAPRVKTVRREAGA